MSQTNVVEELEINILGSVPFFRKSCCLRDVKKCCRAGQGTDTIWRMRTACWIPKATNAHTGRVKFIAFPQQQRLYESSSLLRDTYIASLDYFIHTLHVACSR
jgi:hypothetical protein